MDKYPLISFHLFYLMLEKESHKQDRFLCVAPNENRFCVFVFFNMREKIRE